MTKLLVMVGIIFLGVMMVKEISKKVQASPPAAEQYVGHWMLAENLATFTGPDKTGITNKLSFVEDSFVSGSRNPKKLSFSWMQSLRPARSG